MVPRIRRDDSDELGYLKVRRKARDLGLPGYLNDGSCTIRGRVCLTSRRVGAHRIQIGPWEILSHIFLEIL